MNDKQRLRDELRQARRDHVNALPDSIRALLFKQPPAPLLGLIPQDAPIGLYRASDAEAPTAAYARFFFEAGHPIALPRIAPGDGTMEFRSHNDPFDETDLEPGPFKLMQPGTEADVITPHALFVPLVGFTADGHRLGQGGGYYDRWLADHPDTITIGLGWDAQMVDALPMEAHDIPLTAIVTPTRFYGPFHA